MLDLIRTRYKRKELVAVREKGMLYGYGYNKLNAAVYCTPRKGNAGRHVREKKDGSIWGKTG